MFGIDDVLLGSVVAPAIGGLIGNISGSGDRDSAKAAQLAALQGIQNVNLPDMEAMKLLLDKEVSAGNLDPAMESAILQDPSMMAGIKTDPRLKQDQMSVLDKLSQMSTEGLTPEDKMALNTIRRQTGADVQSRNAGILQNAQSRGVAGSGLEMAMKLQANQEGADRASQEGDRQASMQQQRVLDAIMNKGSQATSMRNQDFSEQSNIARAQDEINKFNSANRQNVANQNIQMRNNAQATNLSNAQDILNKNVAISNQQQIANKQLLQQHYENEMRKAQASSGALNNQAQNYQHQADATGGVWSGIGAGVGQAGAAAYAATNKPATPKYDTKTGQSLHNPATGMSYADEDQQAKMDARHKADPRALGPAF